MQKLYIGFTLLPVKFTLLQLQALYDRIFDKKIDKRNFIGKILSLNMLKKLKEKEKYKIPDKEGIRFFLDTVHYKRISPKP